MKYNLRPNRHVEGISQTRYMDRMVIVWDSGIVWQDLRDKI